MLAMFALPIGVTVFGGHVSVIPQPFNNLAFGQYLWNLSKTSGEITVAGFDIDKDSSPVRKNIGIIFQNPSIDLNLSAEENIRFHSILYGIYSFAPTFNLMPGSYQKRVRELAKVLGIEQDLFKPVKTFSGGMKRKLEIVRSLMHKPKVLFLDEPTTGLDPLSRKNLWDYLKQVRVETKMTIFLTTHYLEEAEDADKVCIINHGKIVALGTPEEIKKTLKTTYQRKHRSGPSLEDAYLGIIQEGENNA